MEQQGNTTEKDWSAFKRAQVRYRRRGDDPNRSDDLDEMIDFSRGKDDRIVALSSLPETIKDEIMLNHPPSIYHGPMYGLKEYPGFCYWPQALSSSLQMELAYRAVSEYCEPPHATNIDLQPPKASEVMNRQDETMWNLWKQEHGHTGAPITSDGVVGKASSKGDNKKKQNTHTKKHYYKRFSKLSWSTMGYHYDWTARCYHDDLQSSMPPLIGSLASRFARTALLHYHHAGKSSSSSSSSLPQLLFAPTASIVNFYNPKSIMGGHRDDLEFAMDKPIVSISLGLPGVFLLGGATKDDGPVAILIRPGDVLCMGAESRLNFHGMARILPNFIDLPDIDRKLCPEEKDQVSLSDEDDLAVSSSKNNNHDPPSSSLPEEEASAVRDFLSTHRINMNVRQVYKDTDNSYE